MLTLVAAFFFGFAEATLFFIVPDVLLGFLALRDLRKAIIACFATVAGALLGGTLVYYSAKVDWQFTMTLLDYVPKVSMRTVARSCVLLEDHGFLGLLQGATQGLPYKTFAACAAEQNLGLATFLMASFGARIIRFLAVTLLSYCLSKYLLQKFSLRTRTVIYFFAWVVFYSFFFTYA